MEFISIKSRQRGVVMIVILIVLGLLSVAAVSNLRSASSTENIAGNLRLTELATQAAETALRHCEILAITNANGGSLPTKIDWSKVSNWDSPSVKPELLKLSEVNPSGISPIYLRPPECMVESLTELDTNLPVLSTDGLTVVSKDGTAKNSKSSYRITARGFGPEVAADISRSRPNGTEVWLQSDIYIN